MFIENFNPSPGYLGYNKYVIQIDFSCWFGTKLLSYIHVMFVMILKTIFVIVVFLAHTYGFVILAMNTQKHVPFFSLLSCNHVWLLAKSKTKKRNEGGKHFTFLWFWKFSLYANSFYPRFFSSIFSCYLHKVPLCATHPVSEKKKKSRMLPLNSCRCFFAWFLNIIFAYINSIFLMCITI